MKNVQWFTFRNDSGETIPAHSFIREDKGSKDDDGQIWITAKKPNASGLGKDIYVTGSLAVPDGGWGVCTNSRIVAVQYDDTDAPIAGDVIGPKSGSWVGWKDQPGAKVLVMKAATEENEINLAWIVRDNANCPTANAIFGITLVGPPTGGAWGIYSWDIDGTAEAITGLSFDCTAAALQTAIEGHSAVGAGNVTVTGGPADEVNFRVEFGGDLAGLFIETPLINFGSLAGTGVGGMAWPLQLGRG